MPKEIKDFFNNPKYLKVRSRLPMFEDHILLTELISEAIIFGMNQIKDSLGKEKK